MHTGWTALYIGGLALCQILVHGAYLFSLLRQEAPDYAFFQLMGIYVTLPSLLGLGLGFRLARKDSLRDCMAYTLPGGLAGAALGFFAFFLFPGLPSGLDLAFLIWVLVFLCSFALFLLSRQLYSSYKHRSAKKQKWFT